MVRRLVFFVSTFSSFFFEPVRHVGRLRPRLSFTVDAASGAAIVHFYVVCFALVVGIDSTSPCAEVGLRRGLPAFKGLIIPDCVNFGAPVRRTSDDCAGSPRFKEVL